MLTVHHFGFLVKSLEKSLPVFQLLGYVSTGTAVYDKLRNVRLLLLEKDAVRLELIEPGESSALHGALTKLRNTAYHVCYETTSISQTENLLLNNGFIRVEAPAPAELFGGRFVAFYAHAQLGMIELLQIQAVE